MEPNLNNKRAHGNRSIFRVFGFFNHFYNGFLDADFSIDYGCTLLAVWKFDGKLEIEKGSQKGKILIKHININI